MTLPTRRILGIPFAMVDYEEAMDAMDAMIEERARGYVCAIAVHCLMVAQDEQETRAALLGARMVVPDGMPIVWAANALGEHLSDRVYGPELMRRYNARCARSGHRIWLFGGHNESWLAELMTSMRRSDPGIRIVGGCARPSRPLSLAEEDAIVERINAAKPDVLWLGLGAPNQEKWMARMRGRLDVPVMGGVGAAFDFLANRTRQAPQWMQRRGLEWLFRMSREPRRLIPRYAYYNPRFVLAIAGQLWRERDQISAYRRRRSRR